MCEGDEYLQAFTVALDAYPVLKGVTLCPYYFQFPSLESCREHSAAQSENTRLDLIRKCERTGASTLLHEFAHLASRDCKSPALFLRIMLT